MNTQISPTVHSSLKVRFAAIIAGMVSMFVLSAVFPVRSQNPFQVALHKLAGPDVLVCVENPHSRFLTLEIRGESGELLAKRRPGRAGRFIYRCSSPDSSLFSATLVLIDRHGESFFYPIESLKPQPAMPLASE